MPDKEPFKGGLVKITGREILVQTTFSVGAGRPRVAYADATIEDYEARVRYERELMGGSWGWSR